MGVLPLLALACGGDGAAANPSAANGSTSTINGSAALIPGERGQGLLEVIDPTVPERPLFRDFGEMNFGEEASWVTRFRNVGAGPIEILSAQAACGCTRLFQLEVVPADGSPSTKIRAFAPRGLVTVPVGAELIMTVKVMKSYTTPNKRKLALFRLTTDSDLAPYMTLEVSFWPRRAFIMAPRELKLMNVPTSHGQEARIKVLVESTGDPGMILGIESAPEGLEVSFVEESFAGEYVWWIDVRVPPLSPLGVIRDKIILRTTDSLGEGEDGRLSLPLIVQIVPDIVLEKPLVAVGSFKTSEGTTFQSRLTALVPGAEMRVVGTRVEHATVEGIEVTATPVSPDDAGRAKLWLVVVWIPPGCPPGFITGDVVFELDEPIGGTRDSETGKELRVRMSGRVTEG